MSQATNIAIGEYVSKFLGKGPIGHYIAGKWVPSASGETFDSINPATGQKIATISKGNAIDIDAAVSSARNALNGPWANMTPAERQDIILKFADLLDKHCDELSLLDSLDMGVPLSLSRPRNKKTVRGRLNYFAGLATTIHGRTIDNSAGRNFSTYTLREPIGVVGAIIPWNAPFTSAIGKIAPVLASGCTMVLKPAEQASLTCLALAQLITDAGVPPGVVNIVTGFGDTGAALVEHPDVNKIAFTGSHAVGQSIMRAAAGSLKRITLELGGKSPNIVCADADLDKAALGAATGVFANSGQVCFAGTRLFVERSIYDDFMERVAKVARSLHVGSGQDPSVQIGPLVSDEQLERVLKYIDIGKSEGATLLSGGNRISGDAMSNGYFVQPTIFQGINDQMRIATEEIFGPVLCAAPFDTLDEVEARANNTPFGLGGGLWTRDINKVQRLTRSMKAGTIWVNCYGLLDSAVPFGGYGVSGVGRELGVESLDPYLETKAVWINGS